MTSAISEANGIKHTSPGQRPGLGLRVHRQAEGLRHRGGIKADYAAGLQPANHL